MSDNNQHGQPHVPGRDAPAQSWHGQLDPGQGAPGSDGRYQPGQSVPGQSAPGQSVPPPSDQPSGAQHAPAQHAPAQYPQAQYPQAQYPGPHQQGQPPQGQYQQGQYQQGQPPHGGYPQPPAGQEGQQPGAEPPPSARQAAQDLADGEWHRMHPLTPFLRGGLGFIIFVGIMLTWGRDRLVGLFMPDQYNFYDDDDPVSWLVSEGYLWLAILGVVVVVALFVLGFYFSWRKREFRVTGDVVELRQGIISRAHRRAPLARIQGIEVQKPWLARIFGCAKLDIEQAGTGGNVDLAYIGIPVARALREEILNRASGRARETRRADGSQGGAQFQQGSTGQDAHSGGLAGHVGGVRDEFLGADPELERYEHTLFKMNGGRLVGSSILSTLPILVIVGVIAIAIGILISIFDEGNFLGVMVALLSMLPAFIGAVVAAIGQIMGQIRFTVAKTQDGIRLSRGLATVTTQTVPPGRVFSLRVSQPLTWRPFGWWKITYGRAVQPSSSNNNNQAALGTTLLPVGNVNDVFRILSLVLSEEDADYVIQRGMLGKGEQGDGFVNSPPRARAFRWFSRKRNGIHIRDSIFVLRKGAIWRTAEVLPAARVQSVGMTQGPIYGMAGLAYLQFHTVGVMGSKAIGAIDARDAMTAFERAYPTVRQAMVSDRSENWGARPVAAGRAYDGGQSAGGASVGGASAQQRVSVPDAPPPSPAYPAVNFGYVGGSVTRGQAEPGQSAPAQPAQYGSAPSQPGSGQPAPGHPEPVQRGTDSYGSDPASNAGRSWSLQGDAEYSQPESEPAESAQTRFTPGGTVPADAESNDSQQSDSRLAPPTDGNAEPNGHDADGGVVNAVPRDSSGPGSSQSAPSQPNPAAPIASVPRFDFPDRPPMRHTTIEHEGTGASPVAPPNVQPGAPTGPDGMPILGRRELRRQAEQTGDARAEQAQGSDDASGAPDGGSGSAPDDQR